MDNSNSQNQDKRPPLPWENLVGRVIVAFIVVFCLGSLVISMVISLYRAVHAPPKAWVSLMYKQGKAGYFMKAPTLKKCVKNLKLLDKELETESTSLWFRIRDGKRRHLRAWQDWAKDWRSRMHLLRKQCPFRVSSATQGVKRGELSAKKIIPTSFYRASTRLLELQKRQEKAWLSFYKKNLWLFREIRQGLHSLNEELR